MKYRPLLMNRFTAGWCVMMSMLLLAGCSRQMKPAQHLERAEAYAEAGEYEAAVIEYMNVLQVEQTNRTALLGVGRAYLEQSEPVEALPFLYAAGRLDPSDLETRIQAATILRLAGKLPEARQIVSEVLEREPQHLEGLVLWADTAGTPEEVEEALERLDAASSTYAEQSRFFLAVGGLRLQQRRLSDAMHSFKRGAALDPESIALWMAIGQIHHMQGEPEQAEKALARAAELSPTASLARVRWADYLYASGQKERALKVLKEALAAAPAFEAGWERMGMYALSERRLDDADNAVRAILAENPESVGGKLLWGSVLLAQGQGEQGIQVLVELAQRYPDASQVRHRLGLALLQEGRVEEARAELRKAVDLDPDSAQVVLPWASLSIRVGAAADVIPDLKRIVERDPDAPEAAMMLGSAYLAVRRPSEALSMFQKLSEQWPDSHVGPFLLGDALQRMKKDDEALAAYDEALRRSPDYVPALVRRVSYDLARNHAADAIARIQARIEATPDQPGLQHLLGRSFVQMKEYELAKAAFRKDIERHPRNVASYLELVRLLARGNEVENAMARVEAALEVDEKNIAMLMLGGMLCQRRQAQDEALAYYDRLLAIEPRFSMAANNAAYIYARHEGDLDRAYELARRARDLAPGEAAIADTLGWIVYLRGEYPWALTLIREGAEGFTEHPDVQYHLGMALLAMGQEEEALVALGRAAELAEDGWPEAPLVDALQTLLKVRIEEVGSVHQDAIDAVLSLDSNSPSARVRQIALLAEGGDETSAEEARSQYQAVLAGHPQFLPATLQMIDLYADVLGDGAEALRLAQKARETWPQDPDLIKRAGWLALCEGDYAWADSMMQECARLLPEDAEVSYHLALAAYCVGRDEEAQAIAEKLLGTGGVESVVAGDTRRFLALAKASLAMKIDPQSLELAAQIGADDSLYIPAQMAIARGHALTGEAAEAVRVYGIVLEQVPTHGPAARESARLYATVLEDSSKAFPLAIQAREALPRDSVVACTLGRLVYERGEYAYAARLLEEGLGNRPSDSESRYLLGLSRHQQGDSDGARKALTRALREDPDSAHAATAKKVLSELK